MPNHYYFLFQTGRRSGSGTDATITMDFYHPDGSWLGGYTADGSGDAFENGTITSAEDIASSFNLEAASKCCIYMSTTNPGNSPNWYLEGLSLEKINSGGESEWTKYWDFNDGTWIDPGETHCKELSRIVSLAPSRLVAAKLAPDTSRKPISLSPPLAGVNLFYFETQTNSGDGSGTDASTYLDLYGGSGDDRWRYPPYGGSDTSYVLDNSGDDMETGDLDLYFITRDSMKPVHTFEITFIPHADDDSWNLDWCRVTRRQLERTATSVRLVLKEVLTHWDVYKTFNQACVIKAGPGADTLQIAGGNLPATRLLEADRETYEAVVRLASPDIALPKHPLRRALFTSPLRVIEACSELKLPIIDIKR